MDIGESGDTVRPLVRNVKFSSCESEKSRLRISLLGLCKMFLHTLVRETRALGSVRVLESGLR